MKLGHFSHVWNKPGMTAAQRYDQLWRELELCDELSFDYAFAVEHHFSPFESWMPSPAVFCASAAAHTRRLRIGPMGYIVALYDPLRIVEEAATLDNVSHGRLELGLVSGIAQHYFQHYGGDFKNRRALANEAIALVKAAFASDAPFSFEGPFHQYRDVTLAVKPLQRPHPPLWLQSRDPDTLAFLAQEGVHTGYLLFVPRAEAAPRYHEYLRLWEQAGHADAPNIAYWTLVYVDETDEQAIAKAGPHVVHAFDQVFGFGDVGGLTREALVENYLERGELGSAEIARNAADLDYLLAHNLVFVGSPETVVQRVKAAAAEGVFNTLLGEFNFGMLAEEQVLRSIRLFGEEVIPRLRDYEPY
jgi:alkanesulfonate monooxygenase SsuD/methylene tetrahydromethanopterin reductase-like flavin-dependent oxidoreductase (luciferase family)